MLSEMVSVSDKFFVWKTRKRSFGERIQLFTGLMNVQHGLISLRVISPTKGNTPYVVESTWLSRSHFQRWIASPAYVLATGALSGNAVVRRKQTEVTEVPAAMIMAWVRTTSDTPLGLAA